jgi:hypothetical protein
MSSYSSVGVFASPKVNQTIDLIRFHMDQFCKQQDPILNLNEIFVLSGKAAYDIQEDEMNPVKNIIFATDNEILFRFVLYFLEDKIKHKGVVKFKDRVLFYFPDFFMEIWFTEKELIIEDTGNGIKLLTKVDIPLQTLN